MLGNYAMGDKSNGPPPPRRRANSLSVTREIDENLKRVYQASLTEEVPDRFAILLAKLREQEKKL